MKNEYYRSFVSEIKYFQELPELNKINIWVTDPPEWLLDGQELYISTDKYTSDNLKAIYYYPGSFEIFVEPLSLEIKQFKYITGDEKDNKCIIL
jgi:hypothetical protein